MENLPKHIAIVMDGNGRWAESRHLPRAAGHRSGVRAARRVIEICVKKGIEVLTLFAFSTENWGRPVSEVSFLMTLLQQSIHEEAKALHQSNVQVHVIGCRQSLKPSLVDAIEAMQKMTAHNTGLKLVIALDYSGRWDFVQAARSIAEHVQQGVLNPADIDADCVRKALCLREFPEPDLFIRTGGEKRISNFMLWQIAYAELFFSDLFWPEFTEKEMDRAFAFFESRHRRFGLLSC